MGYIICEIKRGQNPRVVESDARAVGIVEKELLVRTPFSPKQLIDLVEVRIRRF
jgi:hypothetical protein